jgi:hypothetical protein
MELFEYFLCGMAEVDTAQAVSWRAADDLNGVDCGTFEDILCRMHGLESETASVLLTEWVQVQRVGVPLGRISGRKEELETIREHVDRECSC